MLKMILASNLWRSLTVHNLFLLSDRKQFSLNIIITVEASEIEGQVTFYSFSTFFVAIILSVQYIC